MVNAFEVNEERIEKLKFDANGLIPAVAQDVKSGDVVMLAYMNKESLTETIKTGYATYFSRSRQQLWKKGETSGNVQRVRDAGCEGAIIGKAIYEGRLTLGQALRAARG